MGDCLCISPGGVSGRSGQEGAVGGGVCVPPRLGNVLSLLREWAAARGSVSTLMLLPLSFLLSFPGCLFSASAYPSHSPQKAAASSCRPTLCPVTESASSLSLREPLPGIDPGERKQAVGCRMHVIFKLGLVLREPSIFLLSLSLGPDFQVLLFNPSWSGI